MTAHNGEEDWGHGMDHRRAGGGGHRGAVWPGGGGRLPAQNLAQGINLLYFLPAAATALPAHVKNGYVERQALVPAICAGLVCSALAAWAATAMDVGLLRKCFGGFLLVIGLRELFREDKP